MKGIKKIIAIALMAAMTISFAACSGTAEEKENDDKSNTSQTAQISDGNSENPESSISENTEIEISNPQSEAESKNSDGTSSNPESQTSNQTSKPADTSQTSKPQTSNQTSSKPAEVSQTSNTTSNQNTNSNGTQTSKPSQPQTKPTTPDNTQTSKPSDNNTQTSKPETKPVTPPSVKSITLNKTSLTLTVGQTAKLSYSVNPSNASYKAEWSTSNNSVASISGDGTVTAKSAGKANITIKTSNGKSATCQITVKAKQTESKPTQPSTDTGVSDKVAAAFQAPYEGKLTGWQDTVIEYLREVGEKQYHMTWEDEFYVRDKGNTYNCSFNFPASVSWCEDGKKLQEHSLYLFEELENQSKKWGEPIDSCRFKIIIEDVGMDIYRGYHDFYIYLCYG